MVINVPEPGSLLPTSGRSANSSRGPGAPDSMLPGPLPFGAGSVPTVDEAEA